MADNISVKDSGNVGRSLRTTDRSGVHFPHHIIADGDLVTMGAMADTAATSDTGTFSIVALLKRLLTKLTSQLPSALGQTTKAGSLPVVIASDQGALAVTGDIGVTTNTTILTGSVVTGTGGAALAASAACKEVAIQNPAANTDNVLVGNSAAQTFILYPGESITLPIDDISKIWVKSASGTPTIHYVGVN